MMQKDEQELDFFQRYFDFVGESEAPPLYHRWAAISMIAALLGRQTHFPFGHTKLFPNFYIMLVGSPGTRKGTALSPMKKALKLANFCKFSPDRLSPERFIAELVHTNSTETVDNDEFERVGFETPNEMFVVAPEFGDFIGHGNFNFINLLTNLWDNLDEYLHPKLHGKSISVFEPTINMITATTPQGISMAIPVEAIGQGFMSRLVLVYGEPTGIKITFPDAVEEDKLQGIAAHLTQIKSLVTGQMELDDEARPIFDRIYREFEEIDDFRFKHYTTRRFTHILKLAVISAAARCSTIITSKDALFANTILHLTEQRMPKALGEFGKAKNSETANAVLEIVRSSRTPIAIKDIWKKLSQDLNNFQDLNDIVKNLLSAGKITQMTHKGKACLLPQYELKNGWDAKLLAPELFNLEERI
jgi:hypothetical protein